MLGSGVGEGEGSSDVGISTSVLPTWYGPLYGGKPGVGLICERKETMMKDLTGRSLYCVLRRHVSNDNFMYTDAHMSEDDDTKERAIHKKPILERWIMTFSCRFMSRVFRGPRLPHVFVLGISEKHAHQ